MKATGIVRRIDDLGRVVIPKEIRKTLRIREGTPMEIFTDRQGELILKKYSSVGELNVFAREYAQALAENTGFTVCITDRDVVVAVSGTGEGDLAGKPVSPELETVLAGRERKVFSGTEREKVPVTVHQKEDFPRKIIQPIVSASDVIGAVILMGKEEKEAPGEKEQLLVRTAACFLGRQMEA